MSVWNAVVETHCPMLTRRVRRPGCPWLRDDAVRDVMAERDAARRVWAASRSVADRETYRRLRNRAKQMLTSARRTYLAELLRDDSKRFWTRLKQFGARLEFPILFLVPENICIMEGEYVILKITGLLYLY